MHGNGLDVFLVNEHGVMEQRISMHAAFGSITVSERIDTDSRFPTLRRVWDYKSNSLEQSEIVALREEVELLIRAVSGELSRTIVEDELHLLSAFCSVAIARGATLCLQGP